VQVVASGQPSLRWVKPGRSAGGMIEILSGLAPGDSVLVAADRS
jgi:multidrug efflux pump subunit AcrA (membrane-fusion protein)